MKNKQFYLGTTVLLFAVVFLAQLVKAGSGRQRVHQHLIAPRPGAAQTVEDEFVTHLPIVEIDTGGQRIPGRVIQENNGVWLYETSEQGEKTIDIQFLLREGGEGRNTHGTRPVFRTAAQLRYRGNSSRHFDKKSYAVRFIDKNGRENPLEVGGMAAHHEWALGGPFLDRTLLRNYLCMNVAGEIMPYAPNVRYCELFLDGKYQGVYLLMETVARGAGRIGITKPERNRDMTGWIVRWDRVGKGDHELNNYAFYTYKADVSALDVRYPGENQITDGRMAYINQEISRIERNLYSCDRSDPRKGYYQYLDVEAFAQYFVINEFFRNVDAGRFSTFYYKDVRGKVAPCVWDFNNACDNYVDYEWDEAGFTMQHAPWMDALIRDPVFVRTVVSEYRRLRNGVLNGQYLLSYIDETRDYLGDAVERNNAVWGYMFDLSGDTGQTGFLQPADRNVQSYEESVEQLKDFIRRRGEWLDAHIGTLYQYCADSKNANSLVY